jgi:hypothetical protein
MRRRGAGGDRGAKCGSRRRRADEWRIGVHVGDVVVDGTNLIGDGVNIAARLEALAEPGGICISAAAHGQIGNRLPLAFDDLGDQQVKNIPQPIRVYRVAPTSPHPDADAPGPPSPALRVRVAFRRSRCPTSRRSRSCRFRT